MNGDETFRASLVPDRYFPHRYARASEDFNPLHLDEHAARAVGLPGTILHGLSTMGWAARVCLEQVGGDPRRLRRISVQFRGVGLPEEEITLEATTSGPDTAGIADGTVRVTFQAQQSGRALLHGGSAELRAEPRDD